GTGFDAYTMPKPCWAVVSLDFEPLPLGSGFVYDKGNVPNDQMFYRYQRHVETAVKETLAQGLYGWEVTDLKVTLSGGEHHTVHTHPLDFFLCTPIAVMKGLKNCGTRLLEPYQKLVVSVPEEFSGKIIGDIIAMRGVCENQTIADGRFLLEATVPAAECLDYSTVLLHKTAGKGTLRARFCGYRPCPEGFTAETKRRGVNPLDRDKWILTRRSAMGK
ncbi:MAG: GTP-binding protein, partial [Eubacteriales bacterium]